MTKLKEFYNNRSNVYCFKSTPGSLYDKIYNLINENSIVLDVGCANGNFSKDLKNKNCIVHGIEISDKMAGNAKKVLDKVMVGNIETTKFPLEKRSYDVILLMDVLEHLFDPKSILKKVKPYLRKNGCVIVSIPNVANWEVRKDLLLGRFDSERTAILEEGHIRFFTFKKANEMFARSGYKIKRFDFVVNYPLLLLKIKNRFPFLGIDTIIKNYFYKFFAYQFIFELIKK